MLLVLLVGLAALPVAADCKWEWLCNGDGACKQMPVCDRLDEVPPPKPAMAPPAIPPLAMRPGNVVKTLPGASCEHILRQDNRGKWNWESACYCTDKTKGVDPSNPFRHIVRCDETS
jgi:hypothetical protein